MARALAAVLLMMCLGCSNTSRPASDGDGGLSVDAALPCACGDGYFCCKGECLPFGSVCGAMTDAGLGDTAADGPTAADGGGDVRDPATLCRPRATPQGGSAPVVSACLDADTRYYCAEGIALGCTSSSGRQECREWYDPVGTFFASCFWPGEGPCDPSLDGPRCDGVSLVSCIKNPNYPPYGPVASTQHADCRHTWGDDATCVTGGTPSCFSPTAVYCDYLTYVAHCTPDLAARQVCHGDVGVAPVKACPAGEYCLDNASTRSTVPGVDCIPSGAVPSGAAATTVPVYLSCAGAAAVRVEHYGMEWVQQCPPDLVTSPDGVGSWTDTVCYDATGSPRCELPGTAHCDPATFVPRCSDDGRHILTCTGDTVSAGSCDLNGTGNPNLVCESTPPRCVERCDPATYVTTCSLDLVLWGRWCDATSETVIRQQCGNCTVGDPHGPPTTC